MCPITGLPKDEQEKRAFLASWFATECRLALNGKRLDNAALRVYAWIDESVIPALQKSDNKVIQAAVVYFGDRSYGRKHLLYLWHLLQEEEERATQSPFVTFEVFQILMRGDLEELSVPYEKVMDEYGL
jgi:hypothetical protein